jgi:hypothetical protein
MSVECILREAAQDEALRDSDSVGRAVQTNSKQQRDMIVRMYTALGRCSFVRPVCKDVRMQFEMEAHLKQIAEDKTSALIRLVGESEDIEVVNENSTDEEIHIKVEAKGTRFIMKRYMGATYAKRHVQMGDVMIKKLISSLSADVMQYEGCCFANGLDPVIAHECIKQKSNAIVVLLPVQKTKKSLKVVTNAIRNDLLGNQKATVTKWLKGRLTVVGVPVADEAGSVSTRSLAKYCDDVVIPVIREAWKSMVNAVAKPVLSFIFGHGQGFPLASMLIILNTLSELLDAHVALQRAPTLSVKLLIDTHDQYLQEYDVYAHYHPLAVLRTRPISPPGLNDSFMDKLAKRLASQHSTISTTGQVVPFRLHLSDEDTSSCIRHFPNLGYALCCEQARVDIDATVDTHKGSVWTMQNDKHDMPAVPTMHAKPRVSNKRKASAIDQQALKRVLLASPWVSTESKQAIATEEIDIPKKVSTGTKLTVNDRLQRMAMPVMKLPCVVTIESPICILFTSQSKHTKADAAHQQRHGAAVLMVVYMLLVRYRRGLSKCGAIPRIYLIGDLCRIAQSGPAYCRQERRVDIINGV